MQVYLAARYGRREELTRYAGDLRLVGFDVQAEWITGAHDGTPDLDCAQIDYLQVSAADIVISFTEPPGPAQGRGRGGRHVEFGLAFAMEKRCIVVGHRENVFHHLREVEFYATWPECLAALSHPSSDG